MRDEAPLCSNFAAARSRHTHTLTHTHRESERFQVTGGPGSNMVFRPPNPIKVDVSHLIGASVQEIKLMLVDQHGTQIDSLLGEKFSAVLIIESE